MLPVKRRCTWRASEATWPAWKNCWRKAKPAQTSKTTTARRPCTALPSRTLLSSFRWNWTEKELHSHSEVWLFVCLSGWLFNWVYYCEWNVISHNAAHDPAVVFPPHRPCAHTCAQGSMSWTTTGRPRSMWPVVWDGWRQSKPFWGAEPSVTSLGAKAIPSTLRWSLMRRGETRRESQIQFKKRFHWFFIWWKDKECCWKKK